MGDHLQALDIGHEVLYSGAAGCVASISESLSNKQILVTSAVNCSRWSTWSSLGCDLWI